VFSEAEAELDMNLSKLEERLPEGYEQAVVFPDDEASVIESNADILDHHGNIDWGRLFGRTIIRQYETIQAQARKIEELEGQLDYVADILAEKNSIISAVTRGPQSKQSLKYNFEVAVKTWVDTKYGYDFDFRTGEWKAYNTTAFRPALKLGVFELKVGPKFTNEIDTSASPVVREVVRRERERE
jgi:hypothetical protein